MPCLLNPFLLVLNKKEYTDKELIDLLRQNSDKAIDLVFRKYYVFICTVIVRIVSDSDLAEDLAQDVFYGLWKKRQKIHVNTSLKAYLRRSAKNKTLNYIRDQKIKFEEEDRLPILKSKIPSINQDMEAEELKSIIHQTIDALPERCRMVFNLSRFEEMSYQEIATALNISIKTVENQVSKALKILRKAVKPYVSKGLFLLVIFIFVTQLFK